MDPKHFPLDPSKLWEKVDRQDNLLASVKALKGRQDLETDRRERGLPEPVFLRENPK